MNFFQTLFSATLILGISACSKENTPNKNESNVPLPSYPVVKYVITENNDTIKYTYDSLWRVKTIVGGEYDNRFSEISYYIIDGNDPVFYSYSPTSISCTQNGDVISYIPLNNQGLGESEGASPSTAYTYNTDSTIRSSTMSGLTINYMYSNGNLTSLHSTIPGGPSGQVIKTYQYTYTNTLNTIGNKNIGQAFLGKSSKNAVATIEQVQTDGVSGDVLATYNTTFSYTLNSSGAIETARMEEEGSNGTTTTTLKFVYY